MADTIAIPNREQVFVLTLNLGPRINAFTPKERDMLLVQILRQRMAFQFHLFAYAAMPKELHLLLAPDRLGLVSVVRALKCSIEQQIRLRRGNGIAIWKTRFQKSAVRNTLQFRAKLDYIHQSPVTAGLVEHTAEWRWSSAAQYLNGNIGKEPADGFALPVDPILLPLTRDGLLRAISWRQPHAANPQTLPAAPAPKAAVTLPPPVRPAEPSRKIAAKAAP